MKNLTQEQFHDRTFAELRARRIFIDSGITNNITTAFELYQEILAEQDRKIFLQVSGINNEPPSPIDRYERPLCPDCGNEMRLRPLNPNPEGWKTQWICSNQDCELVLSFQKSVEEWMQELKVKNELV